MSPFQRCSGFMYGEALCFKSDKSHRTYIWCASLSLQTVAHLPRELHVEKM